jgi:uncharacterized RDD family membrane protein YckC
VTTEYSSLGRRIIAFLIDVLIVAIPTGIANFIIPVLGGLIVWFLFIPLLEASELQATIGKNLMGIQVTDLQGGRISLRSSVIRNLLKLISAAIVFIGFFFALFTRKKQTLHDLLAETVVIYGQSERSLSDVWLKSIRETFNFPKWHCAETGLDKIERLQVLREKGALSEAEFQVAKEKILNSNL